MKSLLLDYRIHLFMPDETGLLILILPFGPLLHVVEPENFREKIKKQIDRQMELLYKNQ